MKKGLILSLFYGLACSAQINKDGDFQIWQRNIVRDHFYPKWTLTVMAEERWGDEASKLYHVYLQGQISYRAAKWISIAPGYRQAIRRFPLSSNHWIFEYSPLLDAMLLASYRGWEFTDRNRAQCNLSQATSFPWVYRNRFRIVSPWQITRFRFTPFADNEIFIRQAEGFDQDRCQAGLLLALYGNLTGQISYMARYLKAEPHWTRQNILYLTLLLSY